MTTARAIVALFGAFFLFIGTTTMGLDTTRRDAWVVLGLAVCCLAVALLLPARRRDDITVVLGSSYGLRPGDIVQAHGRNYRIVRINGTTITWRPDR